MPGQPSPSEVVGETPESAASSPYRALPARLDLPAMDHEILEFWRKNDVFARSMAATEGGPEWVVYEGPPTANGQPGTHHVEARVFKDVFPRFKTMKGFHVARQAGWDCHGLPVEIAVEKELGLSGKPDIEKIGIEQFNARCRESVQRYIGEFEEMTERLGYWVDMSHPYWTMTPDYVDSVWWALKQIYDQGLLTQDYRVTPYCPRCGTGLSDHEVAQGYESIVDPSVYVRFPVLGEVAGVSGAELLIWTTTPWTLVSNTAVAVHPDVTYVVVRSEHGTFVLAEALVEAVLGENVEVLASLPGHALDGLRYERPFALVEIPNAHRVITADYVTTEDGTGLVHQAPAFGADDMASCRRYGLPVVNPIGADGHFEAGLDLVGGMFFKDADATLVTELQRSGRLFRHQEYEHAYPHCWRCHTPLMYYAQLSWYIRTTERAAQLTEQNELTNWYPEHIKHGRYGDWLANNIDWALSRNRYWGTPLPLWRCEHGHVTCVGSRAELGDFAGRTLSNLDPHRPYVDDVTFACPHAPEGGERCGSTAHRESEVIDAWFDSGSMPFAGVGYPHREGSVELFDRRYPAQFICEAIDQTRGWFYTLMAVGTLVFGKSSYENVVCLGHIMAEDGRKMSKHLGNIIEPIPFMEKHGADALRWFMLCSGSPWSPRRVGDGPVEEVIRKVLLTYWNTVSFWTLYASISGFDRNAAKTLAERPVLDRWVLAELNHVVSTVDSLLENFDTAGSGRVLAQFIDVLSNWYVRRCRSRFWEGDAEALATLHECLHVVTRLLAPFVPFVAEHVWQQALRPGASEGPDSVHLATWPTLDGSDWVHTGWSTVEQRDRLRSQMELTRQLVEAGRAARKTSKVRIRQPLGRALLGVPSGRELVPELSAEIADELNVAEVAWMSQAGEVVDITAKPNFRALGKRFGNSTQQVAAAIRETAPATLAEQLRATGEALITVDGEEVAVSSEEVQLSEVPRSGWAVASQGEVTVALDTEITPDLLRAGIAREVIRLVQTSRKEAGLAVTDRIQLGWAAVGEQAAALREHESELAEAVLATEVQANEADAVPDTAAGAESGVREDPELGVRVWFSRA